MSERYHSKGRTGCQITLFAEFDLAVLFLVLLDAVADKDKNLAVGGAAFVVGDGVQLIQHLLIDSY